MTSKQTEIQVSVNQAISAKTLLHKHINRVLKALGHTYEVEDITNWTIDNEEIIIKWDDYCMRQSFSEMIDFPVEFLYCEESLNKYIKKRDKAKEARKRLNAKRDKEAKMAQLKQLKQELGE